MAHFYVSICGLFFYLVWSSLFVKVKSYFSCFTLEKEDPFTRLILFSNWDFLNDDSLIMYFFNIQTLNLF
jgi:hypothetical protein